MMDLQIKFQHRNLSNPSAVEISRHLIRGKKKATWGGKRHHQSRLWQRSGNIFHHLAAISDDETLMKVGRIWMCFF